LRHTTTRATNEEQEQEQEQEKKGNRITRPRGCPRGTTRQSAVWGCSKECTGRQKKQRELGDRPCLGVNLGQVV